MGIGSLPREQRERVVKIALLDLPLSTLRDLARTLGVEPPGFRPGRAPWRVLFNYLSRARGEEADAILDAFFQEHSELGNRIQNQALSELRFNLPDLVAASGEGPVWLWLLADGRKGARKLADRVKADLLRADSQDQAAPNGSAPDGPQNAGADEVGPSREPPSGPNTTQKAEARMQRLIVEIDRLKQQKKEADRQAGDAGREVGRLRKRVEELEQQLAKAESASGLAGPVVLEPKEVLERDSRLEAANRQIERLERDLQTLNRDYQALAGALDRQEQRADRLRCLLDGVALATSGGGFRAYLPFNYVGPGGRFVFSKGFGLVVPGSAVYRLDLADGDLVQVTVRPPRTVDLGVVDKLPRREAHGHARRYSRDTWQFFHTDGRLLGWVGDAEARAYGLRDGDPVTVLWPERGHLDSDRRRLPRVRILRVHRTTLSPSERQTLTGLRRTRIRKPRLRRGARFRDWLKDFGKPLRGKKVLVAGGDKSHPAYRFMIESLGAGFDGLGAGDANQAEAKALAADITIVITPYVSHKVRLSVSCLRRLRALQGAAHGCEPANA